MGQKGQQATEKGGKSTSSTPEMTPQQQHMTTQDQDHDQAPIEDVVAVQDGLTNTNVTQRRRKRKKTVPVDVVGPTATRSGSSADKGIASEIKGKNSRQPKPKHAQAT